MKRASYWLKRTLWLLAFFLVVGAGLWAMSYVMLRRAPDWYLPDTSTAEQRRNAADRLENLLITFRNWGGRSHAVRVRADKNGQPVIDDHTQLQAQTALSQKADSAFAISFTDDELNAFFNKWIDSKNRRAWFEQYVDDPRLVIRGKQLIIVGKAKEMDLIVSLVFEPKLNARGDLNLNLVHVLGGILPLADALWWNQRTALEQTLQRRLPAYQAGADISIEGIANGDAASAAMNQLLLATLERKPSGGVIFVPIELQHLSQSLPVKITALSIHDHTVEMTAEQMNQSEREAFLQRLKGLEFPLN